MQGLDKSLLQTVYKSAPGTDESLIHLIWLIPRANYEKFVAQPIELSTTKAGAPTKGWQQNCIKDRIQQWAIAIDFA